MSVVAWRTQGTSQPFIEQGAELSEELVSFIDSVLLRDQLVCQLCGFTSRRSTEIKTGYMQIRPLSSNYDNRNAMDWVTCCPFCHAFHCMTDALDSGQYHVIAAPWISQAELSNVIRPVLIILSDKNHIYYAEALDVYKTLLSAESTVATLLPHVPATEKTPARNLRRYFNLLDTVLTDEQYANRAMFSAGLRVLPDIAFFDDQSAYWDAAQYSNYPVSKWERLVSWKKR